MPGLKSQVGARSALFKSSCHWVVLSSFCCSVIVLFYVLIVCTVTLPPDVNPIAVDKYIYLSIVYVDNIWQKLYFKLRLKDTLQTQEERFLDVVVHCYFSCCDDRSNYMCFPHILLMFFPVSCT